MSYPWLDAYFLSKPGATKDYQPDWEATRYFIGDKMFGMLGDYTGTELVTVKCEPLYGEYLRVTYPDITPGYHMNKVHWNSVRTDGKVPDDVLKEMVAMSYTLVLESLTKKKQKEILDQNNTIKEN